MSDPVRLSVYITRENAQTLSRCMEMTGLSRTDCINQAIKLYELVKKNELDGREHYSRDPRTGKIAQIVWNAPEANA